MNKHGSSTLRPYWLVFTGSLFHLRMTRKKNNLRHPRHLRLNNARKFIVTRWKSVKAELSDDEFQLQLPIYKKI